MKGSQYSILDGAALSPDITNDSLFNGELVCLQHRCGYRFSMEAVLVAHFCRPRPGNRVLDLGAGCGVIGLILAYRHPDITLTGLEFQHDLAKLASENVQQNNLQDRFRIYEADLRHPARAVDPESFDLIVCNPPYRKTGTGRINREDECALARHELKAVIHDVVRAAVFSVRNRGTAVFVYPAVRSAALISALQEQKLMVKRLQPVYSYPGDGRARLVLVEAVKNGGEECLLMEPFYIYSRKNGPYSMEMQQLYLPMECKPVDLF